jgi:hypothetical protein
MFVSVYDSDRLISFSIHARDAVTDKELDDTVALIQKQAAAGAARGKPTTSIILVETENTLDSHQRKALALATQAVQSGYQVIVTSSTWVRMVVAAVELLKPSKSTYHQATHATYEAARAWLVERTKHSPEIFDSLHADVRRQLTQMLENTNPKTLAS